jgi:hypothetical protein
MGQLLASLNLRGNSDIVPEINFDIESKLPIIIKIKRYKTDCYS